MRFNRIQLTTGSLAVLSLVAVSALPARGEIAQRNVYRDSSVTSVDANSVSEFAQIYNAGKSKSLTEESKNAQLSQHPDLHKTLGSKEFQYVLQSKEFQYVLQSKEFQYVLQSKEFRDDF